MHALTLRHYKINQQVNYLQNVMRQSMLTLKRRNRDLAKKDQTKIQLGMHKILQLHIQHLGLLASLGLWRPGAALLLQLSQAGSTWSLRLFSTAVPGSWHPQHSGSPLQLRLRSQMISSPGIQPCFSSFPESWKTPQPYVLAFCMAAKSAPCGQGWRTLLRAREAVSPLPLQLDLRAPCGWT